MDSATGTLRMQNIVDNDVPLGQNVVNQGSWSSGLNSVAQFSGTVSLGQSWYDRSRQAWIINYDAIQTGAGILNGLIANTRDELRLVAPGAMIGKTYAKPFSSLNPLPVAVCDKSGGYASDPNDRVLS
ncbi:hypothetical protein QBZ16_004544 [Prototheca wickerhamii]|uniref:Uncharacterized protein n=1 Tax=Prototheca wickerhamii TaxID=3111 RepID=A0AAD9IHK1_PROWI|nr:hypothetical protein QBZ16_004544 [Prototheca wickerhamii]